VFFTLRAHAHLRGHPYTLDKQRCTNSVRQSFYCNRIVNMWNNLPGDTADFSSFQMFRKTLSNDYLTQLCKVNFNWWLLCSILMVLYVFYSLLGLVLSYFVLLSTCQWPSGPLLFKELVLNKWNEISLAPVH